MTFDQIWKQLVHKKPSLADDNATAEFTAGNLRQLLRQVYEQGEKAAAEQPVKANPFDGIFNFK